MANTDQCRFFSAVTRQTQGRKADQPHSSPRRHLAACLLIVAAIASSAATSLAATSTAPQRVTTTVAEVEKLLGQLDTSVEHASFSASTAPHRLLAEARGAMGRLAAARRTLIGQPWQVAMPLLHRLDQVEQRTRTLLDRLERWQPHSTPTTALSPQGTGTIAGTVKAAADGTPLVGVRVNAVDYYNGTLLATTLTNATGAYTLTGLGDDEVSVRTTGTPGLVDVAFDGVRCEPSCSPYTGAQITTRDGVTVSGIDFALVAAATISGHVTSSVDGMPIAGVDIGVEPFGSGSWLAVATSGTDGAYAISELYPGQYRAMAAHEHWADEAYDNIPCEPWCSSTAGTPVLLTTGQHRGEVDFSLDPTGSISGQALDAATGDDAYVYVELYSGNGTFIDSTYTGGSQPGTFSFSDLPAGTYFAAGQYGQWMELYRELPWREPYDATKGTPVVVTGGQDTPDIDFTYEPNGDRVGSILGQVTDAATGLPLEAYVSVFDASGTSWGSAYTSSAGYYRVASLATGTYFVTANAPQHVAELFDGMACSSACDPRIGTPVTVRADAETTGVDFTLEHGGWIAGRVTGGDSGGALWNATVRVYNATGDVVSSGYSDETGHYAVFGLGSGSYFVTAALDNFYHPSYAGQLYSGILCETGCDLASGMPVPVTVGLPTSAIDFALTPLGDISGTVTDTATGAPIMGAIVFVRTDYSFDRSATTDSAGHYRVRAVPSGNALVLAQDGAFRDELYDNVPCEDSSCSMSAGTPVAVVAGISTESIDFALNRLGTISGRVTRATDGQPLENVSVQVYTSSGYQYRWLHTDQAGDYEAVGLSAGTYFARTYASNEALVNELFDNIPCDPSCTPTAGTPITVAEGQTTADIDFALDTGGTISGRVTDEQSGTPVSFFSVTAYSSTGVAVADAETASTGSYTLLGLPAGTYFVKASRGWSDSSYAAELYNGIPCDPSCTVTTGTPVAVTIGNATTGIDFTLKRLGGISGSVVRAAGGTGIRYAHLRIYNTAGTEVRQADSSQTGEYSIAYLAPGSYFVQASASGFATEVYDDLMCDPTCVVTNGTPVTVTSGTTTTGISLALTARGGISGVVTRNPDGAPISGASVTVYGTNGNWYGWADSGPDGSYSVSDLPAGTFFVVASSAGHYDELYDNLPCESGCTVTSGTPVIVTIGATRTGMDFALLPRGAISGTVVDQVAGAPAPRMLELYDAAGDWVGYTNTIGNGTFAFLGLAPGTYFVRTNYSGYYPEWDEFVDELYNDIPCDSGCTVTSGTPITVTEGSTTTGVGFALHRNGRITGRVTDALFGMPVPQRNVIVYTAGGAVAEYASTDGAGNFSTWYLPAGTYYVTTQSSSENDPWVDQLWQGRECEPSCDPTLGTPVVVANDTVTTGINFALYKPYFADVPMDFWARSHIHAIYRAGITSGCGSDPLIYCPVSIVTRAQTAVFLGKAGHPAGFTPPLPTGSLFADVSTSYWAAAWIEQLWADGLTSGCASAPLRFCPDSPLSRAEMAVFLLGAKHGPDHEPPPATGTVFTDVPITHWAAAWIEELAAEGITAGCAPAMFCPGDIVDRAQMAVFLVRTYSIPY
jgi:hypothetical protein